MADERPGNTTSEHPEAGTPEQNISAAASHVQAGARQMMAGAGLQNEGPSLATAVLVGAGVAILEPEFIPGMLIGAGALLAPKVLPAMGNLLRPVVKGVVKAGYAATMTVREAVAEAGENVQDMVAEARAEYQTANPQHAASAPAAAATETESRRRTKKHSSPGNTGGGSPSTPVL